MARFREVTVAQFTRTNGDSRLFQLSQYLSDLDRIVPMAGAKIGNQVEDLSIVGTDFAQRLGHTQRGQRAGCHLRGFHRGLFLLPKHGKVRVNRFCIEIGELFQLAGGRSGGAIRDARKTQDRDRMLSPTSGAGRLGSDVAKDFQTAVERSCTPHTLRHRETVV